MEIPEIDVDQLAEALEGGANLIDVREPDEWEAARVPGVPLIPLGQVPDRVAEVPADGTCYVICRSGGRSAKACEILRAHGLDAVNVAGGTLAWIESGREVASGPA